MSLYEPYIAIRHLRHQRNGFLSTITWIAVLGVFIGVLALTSVLSITGGFQKAFQKRVLGVNSHILAIKYGIDFKSYRETQKNIEGIDGIEATSPFILHEMIASHSRHSKGVLVKGIEPSTLREVSDLPKYTRQEGALETLEYERFPEDGVKPKPHLLIGHTLAEKLDLKIGESVRLTSPLESMNPGKWSSRNNTPSSQVFKITGIYESGFHEYDSRLVMTDYRALQDVFDQGDVVTGIDVRVKNVFNVKELTNRIEETLPSGEFRVVSWRKLNENLFRSLEMQRQVLFVLFCFIILVGSFNIVCTLLMIVLDKKKEIAILRAMGARKRAIVAIFVSEGLIIGAIGTVAGLIGGLGLSLGVKYTNIVDQFMDPSIYMIDHVPVQIEPVEYLLVAGVALFISFLATIGPALWAASFKPVEGIRYE